MGNIYHELVCMYMCLDEACGKKFKWYSSIVYRECFHVHDLQMWTGAKVIKWSSVISIAGVFPCVLLTDESCGKIIKQYSGIVYRECFHVHGLQMWIAAKNQMV